MIFPKHSNGCFEGNCLFELIDFENISQIDLKFNYERTMMQFGWIIGGKVLSKS
uniref:Uncharacterized protein n=1 Tax=Lepeophtheirus salmonis TaxID=72036 RepID=A0A0K2VAU2_LEPSM